MPHVALFPARACSQAERLTVRKQLLDPGIFHLEGSSNDSGRLLHQPGQAGVLQRTLI